MEASGCLYESAEKVPSCSKFAHNYNLTYSTQGRRAEISWWRCWICWSWCAPHCRSPPCARCPRRAAMCGQHAEYRWQHAEAEYRWHQGGRGAPEAEVREVPWCCVDGLLSQTEPKNYALGDQCNEANSIPCSCILFDTIPASIWVFGCHLQTRFYQWVQPIQLFSNQRTSVLVCIPSAGSKSTHLWYLQDRDPKLVRWEIRNWNVHLGGSNINFTRNDQTKCPAKWDQISIAGLPIVKPQPQLFNIVSTKWHRPIQQNGSKWSKP